MGWGVGFEILQVAVVWGLGFRVKGVGFGSVSHLVPR